VNVVLPALHLILLVIGVLAPVIAGLFLAVRLSRR